MVRLGPVRDPKNDEATYIGKILGFFRYNTPGVPTPYLVEKLGTTSENIQLDRTQNDTLYVAVRASTENYSEEELDGTMFTPFSVQEGDTGFIIPVSKIIQPLLVVRDFGTKNSLQYINCLPQQKWGSLFTRLIKQLMEEREKEGDVLYGEKAKTRRSHPF